MRQSDTLRSVLRPGDFLVSAQSVHAQTLTPDVQKRLHPFGEFAVEASPLVWLRTYMPGRFGGYYAYSFPERSLPWHFSSAPLERFVIYQVSP